MNARGTAVRAAIAAVAVAVTVALSGCTATALQSQYTQGDNKGYIAGSGVTEWNPSQRQDPIDFSGPTETGTTFDSTAYTGKVIVVNFWYAGCPPCRLEATALEKAYKQYASKGVVFIGVNTRDGQAASQAYESTFGVTYPSILDANSGHVQLAFAGVYQPNATPTTLILDRTGRALGRMEGPVSLQQSTLDTLISTALSETGAS